MTPDPLIISATLRPPIEARRAVACTRWRWMPGMKMNDEWRFIAPSEVPCCSDGTDGGWLGDDTPQRLSEMFREVLPDLTDPATLGCLLALVREARGDPGFNVVCNAPGHWGMETDWEFSIPSEAEALVSALEAAGRKE